MQVAAVTGRYGEVEVQLTGLFPGKGNGADIAEKCLDIMGEDRRSRPGEDDLDPRIAVEHGEGVQQPGEGGDVVDYGEDGALDGHAEPGGGLGPDGHADPVPVHVPP